MKNFFVLVTLLFSCNNADTINDAPNEYPIQDKFFFGKVQLQKLTSTTGVKVLLKDSANHTIDQVIFKYVPYRFDTADVDRNGGTEILVGLIKPTEFDPEEKKRLFVLRIDNGQLRPLWLGSKVCQELIDFKSEENGIVRTIEKTSANTYAIGNYYWEGFGFTLEKYTHKKVSFNEAMQIFHQAN